MKRAKNAHINSNNGNGKSVRTDEAKKNESYQVYSELMSRANIAATLGQQFGGNRDIYDALGYRRYLYVKDYAAQYSRQDIASAVIDRPIDKTWEGDFKVTEPERGDSLLENEFDELKKQLKLKSKFKRLDRLTSLGEYGILLLGFDGVKTQQDFVEPVQKGGKRKLLYVKPLSQESVRIEKYDEQPDSPRYGLPLIYDIDLAGPDENEVRTLRVHWQRIIHVTGKLLESEIRGIPVLKNIFNRLQDLERLVGGSAEMFWRGARPGYQANIDPNFEMSSAVEESMKQQVTEYENNLRRIFMNQGMDLNALTPQVADPKGHVDVQLKMISSATQIPLRILTGSESAELASSQDVQNWTEVIVSRREEYINEQIIIPFIERMMEFGVLSSINDEPVVQWPDAYAKGEDTLAQIGKTRAEALKNYVSNAGGTAIVPPDAFLKFFLGLNQEQVDEINDIANSEIREEQEEAPTEEEAE